MSFTLQWTRDGIDIPGATGDQYTPTDADRGHRIFFRVVATNPAGSTTATSAGVLIPAAAGTPPLVISGTPNGAVSVGQVYNFTPVVTGGVPPYTYSIPAGALPTGVTLNATTGTINGTPTTAQVKTGIVLTVTDTKGAQASLPAFSITVTAVGTGVNPTNYLSVISTAAPGSTFLMAPGDYGNMGIFSVVKAAPGVTLQGQQGVTCNWIDTGGSSNITLKNITFTGLQNGQYGIFLENCDHITVDGCTTPGNNPGGVHNGVGIFCRNASNLTITNNVLTNLGDGIDVLDCTNVTASGNNITKFSANAMFWTSIHTGLIEKNYMANLDFIDGGTHPDSVQIAGNGSTGRSNNVTIRNNNFDCMTGTPPQGIGFCEDTDTLVITGNCTFGALDNGQVVARCTKVTIGDNFDQGWTYSPRIYCRGGSDTVNMTGNWCAQTPFALVQAGEAPCTNVTIGANTLISNATGPTDTTLRNQWLASHPLVPTVGGSGGTPPWTAPVISPALPDPNASFHYLNQDWWAQSGNPAGITFPAPFVIRAYNTPADIWYFDRNRVPPDNRSEYAQKTTVPNGTRVFISVDILWEAGALNDAAYLTFLQARDTVEVNSSPFAFMMQYQSEKMRISLYHTGAYHDVFTDTANFARDTWYNFKVDLLISGYNSPTGKCKVIRDNNTGSPLVDLSNIAIGWSGMGTSWYYKNGVYRGAASGSLATNQGMQFRNLAITNPYNG